jgi:hypothetical protein
MAGFFCVCQCLKFNLLMKELLIKKLNFDLTILIR